MERPPPVAAAAGALYKCRPQKVRQEVEPVRRGRALRAEASYPQLGNATTHLGRLPGLLFPSQAGSMDDAAWDKLFVAGAKTPYNAENARRHTSRSRVAAWARACELVF